jgi:TonB family protein
MAKRSMSEPLSTLSALSYPDCCVLEKGNDSNGTPLTHTTKVRAAPCMDYGKAELSRVPRTTRELALFLAFNDVASAALSISTASGAAIALIQHGSPVFSVTSGVTAPQVSASLTRCSAGRWKVGKPQLCQDAGVDSGVEVRDLRKLGVRSFIVVPVLDKDNAVTAIIEVFSPHPHGLSHLDLLLLRSLGQQVANHIELAERVLASFASEVERSEINRTEITADREATSRHLQWLKVGSVTLAGKGWNLVLGTLTILVAILVGWALGRSEQEAAGRNVVPRSVIAFNQLPAAQLSPEREIGKAVQLTPQPTENGIPSQNTSDLNVEEDRQPDSASRKASTKSKPSTSKPKRPEALSGGLVIFERGKQIFPESSQSKSSKAQSDDTKQTRAHANNGDATVTVSEEVADEHLLERIEPDYPDSAREQHLQGMVVLNIRVDERGRVRSLSRASGDPQLSVLAAQAVRQWRFTPLLRDGTPVNFQSKVTLNFVLP